jgi:hypothetical protein
MMTCGQLKKRMGPVVQMRAAGVSSDKLTKLVRVMHDLIHFKL